MTAQIGSVQHDVYPYTPEEGPMTPEETPEGVNPETGEVGQFPATGEIVTPAPTVQPFSRFLLDHRRGVFHGELTDALAAVVQAVEEHAKGGAVSVTITVKPGAKGTSTLVVSDSIKTKIPEGERQSSIFYPDAQGGLHRSDPRQPELPLRQVPRSESPLRKAPDR